MARQKLKLYITDSIIKSIVSLNVNVEHMYKKKDGTIIGAWRWNDGYNIKNDLKRDFKSLLEMEK